MAAPEERREDTTCARCFAHVPAGQAYCPECGAPTGEATPAADSKVHGELAQANLLRLRGDLDGSEKALLAILRRFPNDPHAHEMLGDVFVERGETDRAAEWYELALDLAPSSPDVRRKLQEARDHVDEREVADTAETLGLPSARTSLVWWPLAVSGALVILAIAIAAWPRSPAPRPLQATVVAPPPVEATPANVTPTPAPTPIPAPTVGMGTEEDRKLLADLQARAGATRVQTVSLDPRTQTLEVSFEVSETDDAKSVATALGKEALAVAPAAMVTSLRALRAGRLVFAADLPRSAMGGDDPLTNVWPAPPSAVPLPSGTTGATAPPTGATTTGATPPATTVSAGTPHAGP